MESWEHVWEDCRVWMEERRNWQEVVEWVLREEGEGEWWMRELERERGREEGERMSENERESENAGEG